MVRECKDKLHIVLANYWRRLLSSILNHPQWVIITLSYAHMTTWFSHMICPMSHMIPTESHKTALPFAVEGRQDAAASSSKPQKVHTGSPIALVLLIYPGRQGEGNGKQKPW